MVGCRWRLFCFLVLFFGVFGGLAAVLQKTQQRQPWFCGSTLVRLVQQGRQLGARWTVSGLNVLVAIGSLGGVDGGLPDTQAYRTRNKSTPMAARSIFF